VILATLPNRGNNSDDESVTVVIYTFNPPVHSHCKIFSISLFETTVDKIRKKEETSSIINNSAFWVGFEVLTAVSTKMGVFWVVAPCSHQGDDDGGSRDL
jgi:hypothetical protein